jgi:FOG: TPR repeat, SEL1 subfamily
MVDLIENEQSGDVKFIFDQIMKEGIALAFLTLGKKYYEGDGRKQSYTESVKWFLESARSGNAESCNYIGEMREKGEGLPVSMEKAWEWYERGAERGDTIAKYNYGRLLRSGEGGTKDSEAAVDNWYAAAKADYLPAVYKIAEVFEKGITVPIKPEKAFEWYLKGSPKRLYPCI